jgi:hypothetical protein
MLLMDNVEEQYGIEVLEAEHVSDLIGFMIENKSIEQKDMISRNREIPDLKEYNGSNISYFTSISQTMIKLEEGVIDSINDDEIRGFFDNEIKRQSSILEQGYLFSAANEAFLNYIDVSTINAITENKVDIARKKGDVSLCLSRLSIPEKTDRNFEWIIGAELRKQWATDRFNAKISSNLLQEEKFIAYNELMYGQAWCHVSSSLLSGAPVGGQKINESLWKSLANEKITEARALNVMGDLKNRLDIAEDSYSTGLYGAAVFDAVFVIESKRADTGISTGVDVEIETVKLLSEDRKTMWGQIYQSHGAFLYEMNETTSAYRALRLAAGLENATLSMKGIIGQTAETEIEEEMLLVIIAAMVSTFLLLILLILIIRRVHGPKENSTDYRIGKKKSRI